MIGYKEIKLNEQETDIIRLSYTKSINRASDLYESSKERPENAIGIEFIKLITEYTTFAGDFQQLIEKNYRTMTSITNAVKDKNCIRFNVNCSILDKQVTYQLKIQRTVTKEYGKIKIAYTLHQSSQTTQSINSNK